MTTDAARFVVFTKTQGGVALDVVSLFPRNTFRGRQNGLRKDLAETIAAHSSRSSFDSRAAALFMATACRICIAGRIRSAPSKSGAEGEPLGLPSDGRARLLRVLPSSAKTSAQNRCPWFRRRSVPELGP